MVYDLPTLIGSYRFGHLPPHPEHETFAFICNFDVSFVVQRGFLIAFLAILGLTFRSIEVLIEDCLDFILLYVGWLLNTQGLPRFIRFPPNHIPHNFVEAFTEVVLEVLVALSDLFALDCPC